MVNLKNLINTPVTDPSAVEHRPSNAVDFTDEHEEMIDDLISIRSHMSFVESLYDWGQEKGWLTAAQDAKLRQIHEEKM